MKVFMFGLSAQNCYDRNIKLQKEKQKYMLFCNLKYDRKLCSKNSPLIFCLIPFFKTLKTYRKYKRISN